jgi:acid phosphatase type 7
VIGATAPRVGGFGRRRLCTPLVAALTLGLAACGGHDAGTTRAKPDLPETEDPDEAPHRTDQPGSADGPVTVLAAGDIASCGSEGDERTAALLGRHQGTVLVLGDAVYDSGEPSEFQECYEPTWGRALDRTRPVPGNHDYETDAAQGYFDFFGSRAGAPRKGWYSYDLGAWHLIALNSNCREVGGCDRGSEQERWLRADLNRHRTGCTLAYWHHPRFSSGVHHGSQEQVSDLWQALYEAGADVVLSGHEHNYERFAPLDPTGDVDNARGIQEFVVGTGGRSLHPFGRPLPGSELRESDTYGVLQLTLNADSYDWQFVPIDGRSFTDAGSGGCH